MKQLAAAFAIAISLLMAGPVAAVCSSGGIPQDAVAVPPLDLEAFVKPLVAFQSATQNGSLGTFEQRTDVVTREVQSRMAGLLGQRTELYRQHRSKVSGSGCHCARGQCREDVRFTPDYIVLPETIRGEGQYDGGYPRRDGPHPNVVAMNFWSTRSVAIYAEGVLTAEAVNARVEQERLAIRAALVRAGLPDDTTALRSQD